jgi:predicted Zn finger-like uncharacterized protein
MSLATRCPACGTAFRVVQDQLKVSEGWVRCGRCSQVFNALEGLFDLERDGWSEPVKGAPSQVADAAAPELPGDAGAPEDGSTEGRPDAQSMGAHPGANTDSASPLDEDTAEPEAAPAQHGADEREPAVADAVSGERAPDSPRYSLERPAAEDPEVPRAHRYAEDDAEEPPLEAPLADLGSMPTTGMDLPPFVSSGPGLLHQESVFPAMPALRDDADGDASPGQGARHTSVGKRIDAHLFGKRRSARRHAPAPHVSARDQIDFSDARFDSDLLADDALEPPAEVAAEGPGSETTPFETTATPEFVRRAEQEARWQRPAVRAALGAATLALAGMLALQGAHHFRDDAAVRWPALKPLLAGWCELAGCNLEAPRHIDDISVESTALTRAPDDAFRLSVTLRSHGNAPVALPWIDLTLTDAGGRLIARRALATRELRPTAPVLQPGQEVGLQALVTARNARIAGYTVEIFYP